MNRVLVSVEGQTEETFVREILTRHLWNLNVDLIPVVVSTKIFKQGKKFKGGLSTYVKVRNDVHRLLKDTSACAVTTMYDLFKLPTDFPGYATRPIGDCFVKAAYLETEFQRDVSHSHFKPYLQLHEFEALLFVNPEITVKRFTEVNKLSELLDIRNKFNSPEEINDGETTSPSKRILRLFPYYEKPLYGVLVAIDVGLENIRAECAHFNAWLTWLETLGRL
ncbi:MAG: DUF4276 family protein [Chloroflexota bacterium]